MYIFKGGSQMMNSFISDRVQQQARIYYDDLFQFSNKEFIIEMERFFQIKIQFTVLPEIDGLKTFQVVDKMTVNIRQTFQLIVDTGVSSEQREDGSDNVTLNTQGSDSYYSTSRNYHSNNYENRDLSSQINLSD